MLKKTGLRLRVSEFQNKLKKLGNTILCKYDVPPKKCFEVDLKQNGEKLNRPLSSESKLLSEGSGANFISKRKTAMDMN